MTIINQNIQHEMFVKTLDLRDCRGLEQRVQHMEAGLIGGRNRGALDFHAAEATYVDALPSGRRLHGHPRFQLGHFGWAVVDEIIHDILLTQPVATRYCIVKVIFEAVAILRDSGAPSAATVWLRIGYTFEISAILHLDLPARRQLQHVIPRHRRLMWQDRQKVCTTFLQIVLSTAPYFRVEVPESYGLRTLFHCSFIGTTV